MNCSKDLFTTSLSTQAAAIARIVGVLTIENLLALHSFAWKQTSSVTVDMTRRMKKYVTMTSI